jgi:uncharacterized membrane-anchored protein YitT (DUF2179 family)
MKTALKDQLERLTNFLLIALGILSATFGIKTFLIPNNFIDGGITGVSMLISEILHIQLPPLLFLINIPFILMAFWLIGRRFAISCALSILCLALVLFFVPFPQITHDKLLASVFGGFFLGTGIGLSIRGGSVLDGTEILALILSKKTGSTVGGLILIANIFIFGASAFFLGLESAMYSILTYLSASRTIDFILHGLEEYTGITIVSSKSDLIKEEIFNQTERGVTLYKGQGGFSKLEQDILFCVVTRLEIQQIKSIVYALDEGAFFLTHTLNEATGGRVKALTPALKKSKKKQKHN